MYEGSLGKVSNREDWTQTIACVDDDGGDVNIASATIRLAVRKKGDSSPTLTAANNDGITISSPNFTFAFSPDDLGGLCPGQYEVGCTIEISSVTTQLIVGTVTIVDGVVTSA